MAEMTNIPEPSGMKPEAETPASESKAPVNERTTKKEERPVSGNGKNAARSNEKRPTPKRNNLSPKLPPNRPGQGNETNLNHIFRTLLLWAVMFVGVAGLFFLFKGNGEPNEVEVTNTYYQRLLADGKFKSAKIEQYGLNQFRFHGALNRKEDALETITPNKTMPGDHIVVNLIPETINDQYKIWNEKGLTITKEDSTSSWM